MKLYHPNDPPDTLLDGLDQRFSHLNKNRNHLGRLNLLDLSTRVSETIGLGWSTRIFIFNKFTGDAEAAGLETTLQELLH